MVKAKTHEFKKEVYVKIPQEIVKTLGVKPGDELEFKIESGKVIISKPLLSSKELEVLRKMNSVKHYERTKDRILKLLSKEEVMVLEDLINKGIVFESKKGSKKLLRIKKEVFPLVVSYNPLVEKLYSQGYVVIEDPSEARELEEMLLEQGKSGEVTGVRGFDKKYYVVLKSKVEEMKPLITKALESPKVIEDLAKKIKVNKEFCKALIEVLRENGEVIEKKKNLFQKA